MLRPYRPKVYLLFLVTFILIELLLEVIHFSPRQSHVQAAAPITPSGLNTQVNLAPTPPPGKVQYDITGGYRAGTNLFHSFGQFNVPTNNIANFLNDSGLTTSNILGRVTDGNPSNIFGTIQTTGFGGANLFLMNPAGIVFGPNATLNVGGSVTFTTANYLRLADNALFNAIPNAGTDALLSAAPVAAYGFLGSNSGAITVQGSQFTLSDGTGISLVGGNIAIQSGTLDNGTVQPARLSAPNGRIQLASAASPGEFDAATLQALPNVNGASFTSFGSVTLAPGSNINVSGVNTVSIRGGQFVLSVNDAVLSTSQTAAQPETISLSPGSSIVTSNSGADPGANVQFVASNVQLDGASVQSLTTGDGSGGNISISGDTVSLTNGAQIVSSTSGTGGGGNITVEATESLTISGFDVDGTLTGVTNPFAFNPNTGLPAVSSGIYSLTSGGQSATGGAITITAQTVSLDNGAMIATIASGDGAGGNIAITNSGTVTLTGGATLLSSAGQDFNTFDLTGSGRGGDITVSASNTVLISGGNLDLFAVSTISSQTENPAPNSGRAGDITISAPNVILEDSGTILSSSLGTGRAGNVDVTASNQLSISGFNPDFLVSSGILTSVGSPQDSQNNGGGIRVSTPSMTLENRGLVQTLSNANGTKAGDITLEVGNLTLHNGGQILTSGSGGASSGHIQIIASGAVTISGEYIDPNDESLNMWSTIKNITEVNTPTGTNGGIDIHARTLTMMNGPQNAPGDPIQIESSTGADAGGTIRIVADESILMSSGANILNRKGSFEFGSISLTAPSITLSQSAIRGRTNVERDAGAITLTATAGDLTLANDSHVLTTTVGAGKGGPASLQASGSILISGGSTVETSAFATGDAGSISLLAGNQVTLSGAGTALMTTANNRGNGGTITVEGHSVTLSDRATMSANTTSTAANAGNAGNITVKADTFSMNGGATITASSSGSGAAGNLTIEGTASPAQSVLIDGAASGIFTDTSGTGAGGNIFVNANSMTLQNGGTLSAKTSGSALTARGGSINVNATDQVAMTGGALITASSTGAADAGNITINAGNTFMMTNSSVITKSDNAGGGNIAITAVDQVRLVNSKINASAYLDGGNITIDPNAVILQNSQILAQAIVGNGGAINIFTPLFLADQTSLVDASSQFGLSGPVNIQSPTSNLAGSIASLPSSLRQTQSLQTGRCAALHGETSSSFVVAGRETIPTEPGGWVMSPIASLTASAGLTVRGDGEEIPRPNMGEMQIVSLRRLTPIGFLTQYFAESAAIGCRT